MSGCTMSFTCSQAQAQTKRPSAKTSVAGRSAAAKSKVSKSDKTTSPDNVSKTPVLTGTIGGEKAKMQLTFSMEDNKVTAWYYFVAGGPKSKRQLTGQYEGDILCCTVKLEMVTPDEGGYSFSGDYAHGHMMGQDLFLFEGTALGYGDMEEKFIFEN